MTYLIFCRSTLILVTFNDTRAEGSVGPIFEYCITMHGSSYFMYKKAYQFEQMHQLNRVSIHKRNFLSARCTMILKKGLNYHYGR